jgi:ectoine hydroxylase-related dioxygenase (phytanoyl-CoA dioxygenase family)
MIHNSGSASATKGQDATVPEIGLRAPHVRVSPIAARLLRPIANAERDAYNRDGAVVLRGVVALEWIAHLRRGFETLERHFGPDALIERPKVGTGRYVNEQDRWRAIPEFYDFAMESPIAEIAASMMESATVNFFMDQYFIKDEGVVLPTPWHQDLPYLSVSGHQILRIWVPTDPMPREMSLELALGSHRDDMLYRPVQATPSANYRYDERLPLLPAPDEIRRRWRIGAWDVDVGDCLVFHAALLHGSPGGTVTGGGRRHVAAYMWAGDDARYTIRPGRNMPPLPVPDVEDGGRLDSPAFPRVWPRPVPPALAAMRPPRPSPPAG